MRWCAAVWAIFITCRFCCLRGLRSRDWQSILSERRPGLAGLCGGWLRRQCLCLHRPPGWRSDIRADWRYDGPQDGGLRFNLLYGSLLPADGQPADLRPNRLVVNRPADCHALSARLFSWWPGDYMGNMRWHFPPANLMHKPASEFSPWQI